MAIRKSSNIALITLAILTCLTLPGSVKHSGLLSVISSVSPAYAADAAPAVDVPANLANRYKQLAASVDQGRITAVIKELSKHPSRVVGYPGADQSGEYVLQQFRQIGLEDVQAEPFTVTVPVDEGASLEVGGRKFKLNAVWPNLVRTSQLPPEGLDCHLIYGGYATLPEFDGV
jgi:hypothetical protein